MVKMAGIECKNIHKTYPVDDRTLHVLKGIDLHIPEKSITVILGRSGCGKTTLLRLVGDLEKPDSGEIHFDAAHKTAFVFQESRLMPGVSADTETYRDVLDAVKGKGLQVQHPAPGDVLDFNGLPVEIIGPVKEYSNMNNNSMVLRVSVGETAFLFTGDAEVEAEFDILEQGFDISADVLKVSHHGSSGSSVEEFLAYTNADYAVISVGKGNIYDHPEAVTLKRLQNYGMEIFRTDEQGTIVCSTNGETISFRQEGKSSQSAVVEDAEFIGNIKSMKYHTTSCKSLPIEKNRAYFADQEAAEEAGYAPCGSCKP